MQRSQVLLMPLAIRTSGRSFKLSNIKFSNYKLRTRSYCSMVELSGSNELLNVMGPYVFQIQS